MALLLTKSEVFVMKKIRVIAILVMLVFLMTACNKVQEDAYKGDQTVATTEVTTEATTEVVSTTEAQNSVTQTYPLTVVDKFGKEIVIENEPQKVISFSPELVEIMYAIEAGDKLIGRSQYCDYPEQALSVPEMGDLFNLSIEAIVEASPDLVLLSSMASEDVVNSLTAQGVKVVTLDADTNAEGAYSYIKDLGQLLNRVNEAEQLTLQMQEDIAQVVTKIEGLEKPTAYFVIGVGEYDSAATGDTFIGKLMELAGAENAAADGTNWMYNVEQLVEKNPEILICSKFWDTKATIIATEGYKDLSAVKEGKLYEVDENIFYRQGPRMVDAIKVLAEIFHPEAF